MRCAEIREYVFAFLDNELDAPLSMEFQRHVDSCHTCAHEVEIEWAVKKQLGETLTASGDAELIDDRELHSALVRSGLPRAIRQRTLRRLVAPLALAAVIALAFVAWFSIPRDSQDNVKARFESLVIADFEHFIDEGSELQIASSDRREVAQWLFVKTTVAVTLPSLHESRFELVGGRKCKIDGRPAAFAIYETNGSPVSLVAVNAADTPAGWSESGESIGGNVRAITMDSYTVLTMQRGPLLYAAVSTLPQEQFSQLIMEMDIAHEGN